MIGQKKILERMSYRIENGVLPHFNIICGEHGSGKKKILKFIVDKTGFMCYQVPDHKVETIRTAINDMYKTSTPTIFAITDIDDMSVASKNVLLKIAEECPRNVYIIMTVCDVSTVLDTMLSRANVEEMDLYTADELLEYAKTTYDVDSYEMDIVKDICTVPADVDLLVKMGMQGFYEYVQKVVDNIAYVGLANVFKLTSSISLKPDSDGYDLRLFLRAFSMVCNNYMKDSVLRREWEDTNYWLDGIKVTADSLQALTVRGINKGMLLDVWILSIRRVWA